jgi:hypothetical protein
MNLINITPCSAMRVNGRFAGTCRLYLQGGRISRKETGMKALLTFNGLHSLTSQKIELFVTTSVRTSNHT